MTIKIRHCAEPLTDDRLAAVQTEFGIELPDDYRDFLLQSNGGVVRPDWFEMAPEGAYLQWFLPVGRTGVLDPKRNTFESAFARLKQPDSALPENQVPIAEGWSFSNPGVTPDFFTLSVTGHDKGAVYFYRDVKPSHPAVESPFGLQFSSPFEYRFERPRPAAASLQALLDGLQHRLNEEPTEWLILIQDGDIDGFRAWLDGGRNRHMVKDRLGTALEHAIDEWQWEIVMLLVERGQSATEAFEQAMNNYRYPIARQLLMLEINAKVLKRSLTQLAHVFWDDTKLVEALLVAGANPNQLDNRWDAGDRPLHYAAATGNVESIRVLLSHGAKPNAVNKAGQRPVDVANAAGHTSCVEILNAAT